MGGDKMFDFLNPDNVTQKPLPAPQGDEYAEEAWGIETYGEPIKKLTIGRPHVGDDDVKVELDYCGICYSDLSCGCNKIPGMWSKYPCIPGHELVGRVVEVGKNVADFKVGEKAGIGTYVDTCLGCPMCQAGRENYCFQTMVFTYSGTKKFGRVRGNQDIHTFGGYSRSYVCHQKFVFKLPDGMALEKAGPLLCAGITMFEPLVQHGALAGKKKVGIAGIGGLGTMGIKLAHAMGNTVTAISSSNRKKEAALQKGATNFIALSEKDQMMKNMLSLDLVLDTVPVEHDVRPYLSLIAPGGTLILIGAAGKPIEIGFMDLLPPKNITSSGVGSIKSTKHMIQFCFENNVYPDIELITADRLNETWAKLQKEGNSSSIRYVLDIKASK